jgi:hypothetical protein
MLGLEKVIPVRNRLNRRRWHFGEKQRPASLNVQN